MSRTSPEILRSRYLIQAKFGHKTALAGTMALILMAASVGLANASPASFADLVEDVSPAVVNIATVSERSSGLDLRGGPNEDGGPPGSSIPEGHPFRDFFEKFFEPRQFGNAPAQPQRPRQRITGAGSGFIIDAEGYVVTNSHVIEDATSIKITLRDGRNYDAELIGQDPKTDLALLKIEAKAPLPFVAFGNSDQTRVGDWVLTVGNPFGLGGSVTAGIVSARGRDRLGARPGSSRRHADRFPADRRPDQPGQLGRTGVQFGVGGHRCQHRHLLTERRQCGNRFRNPLQPRLGGDQGPARRRGG